MAQIEKEEIPQNNECSRADDLYLKELLDFYPSIMLKYLFGTSFHDEDIQSTLKKFPKINHYGVCLPC